MHSSAAKCWNKWQDGRRANSFFPTRCPSLGVRGQQQCWLTVVHLPSTNRAGHTLWSLFTQLITVEWEPAVAIVHSDDEYYSSHTLINQNFNHRGAENKARNITDVTCWSDCVMIFRDWSTFYRVAAAAEAAAAADTRCGGLGSDPWRGKLMTLLGLSEFYMQSTSLHHTICQFGMTCTQTNRLPAGFQQLLQQPTHNLHGAKQVREGQNAQCSQHHLLH